jgi:hypothetical protein
MQFEQKLSWINIKRAKYVGAFSLKYYQNQSVNFFRLDPSMGAKTTIEMYCVKISIKGKFIYLWLIDWLVFQQNIQVLSESQFPGL